MIREYIATAFIGLLLFIAADSPLLGADDAPCFDSGASYRCPDCGWFVWSEGSMNRDGTYEPMVAHLRIVNHQYDCQDAQREKYAAVVDRLNADEKDIKTTSDFDWLQHDLRDNGLSARMDAAFWENQDPQTTASKAFAARDQARVKAVEQHQKGKSVFCDCVNCNCCCARAVPQVSLEHGWKRGPMPHNTWYWGAVTLTGQRGEGFYFADFYGSYVLIDIDGKKRRIEPADVGYYNNSLRAPKRSD